MGKQKKQKADQLKPLEKHYDCPDDQPLPREIGDDTESNVFNQDSGNIEHSQNRNDPSPGGPAKGMDA